MLTLFLAFTLSGCFGAFGSCVDLLDWLLNADPSEQELPSAVPDSLSLVFDETGYLQAEERDFRDCRAVVNGGTLNPDGYDVKWYLDGEHEFSGSVYTFGPSDVARSVAVAVILDWVDPEDETNVVQLTAQTRFVYYEPFDATALTVARRAENGGAAFTLTGADADANVIEWFVDGKKQACEENSFTLVPEVAGYYDVSVTVNGRAVAVEDPTVKRTGSVKPSALTIDYDSLYPSVAIEWEGADAEHLVKVTPNGGEEQTFTTRENRLVLTQEQCPVDTRAVSVSVALQADGDAFLQSEFVTAKQDALSEQKRQYLNTYYEFGNAYLSSADEFYLQYDGMMLARPQPDETNEETKLTRSFYMGYSGWNLNRLLDEAFDLSGYTGTYSYTGKSVGSVVTVEIFFYTSNVPVPPQKAPSLDEQNLNGYVPALSKTGRASDVLPIDAKPALSVSITDQLYRAAELGYRPDPEEGTAAYACYQKAREVVKSVTDEGMNDYQIALALYDWVTYANCYDNSVVDFTTEQAVVSPAFYLEGILYAEGYGYAVCDGISKTYSLLCNVAGVECVRVVGLAGEGSFGGHAWNKVKVDGQWYVVDATWGDSTIRLEYRKQSAYIEPKPVVGYFEIASHDYFLVTDAQIADDHVEEGRYPATALKPYGHYKSNRLSQDSAYDFYLDEGGAELKAVVEQIKNRIVRDVNNNLYVSFSVDGVSVTSRFFFYEFSYSDYRKNEINEQFGGMGILLSGLRGSGIHYVVFPLGNDSIGLIASKYKLANNSLSL